MTINNKILIVDDNSDIHQDFKLALEINPTTNNEITQALEKKVFGKESKNKKLPYDFKLFHAYSAEETLTVLQSAEESNAPIGLIFMDIKLPNGMDGINVSKLILEKYPHTEIVLCTGYSDYTHDDILGKFGLTDHILLLRKPIDFIEVRQLAIALMQKWIQNRELELHTSKLELEVKNRTKELEDALAQVKKSDLAKSNFLSLMSHEIRNPINSIIGLIDLIQKCKDQLERENYIKLTQKASQTLLELVNDVLDLTKIEAHQLILENKALNLPFIIEQLISNFSIPVLKNGVELISRYPITLPKEIYGDAARIKQILTNFLANASKFTPKGSITLQLEYTRLNENKGEFTFKIIDTGIGITEKDQSRLFTDYTKIHDGMPYNLSGTGLGLSIAKKLATLMDGDVGVQSKKGQGSTFWLKIQLNISGKDGCIIDQSKISKMIGLIVVSNSTETKIFFEETAKDLGCSCFVISEWNELSSLLKNMSKPLTKLHVFFDFDKNLSEKSINDLEKYSANKFEIHPIVPLLNKLKSSQFQQYYFNPISKPLILSEVIRIISSQDSLQPKSTMGDQKTIDLNLLDKIKRCKILLVDDDPMALLITSTNLKNFGFSVDQAESSDLAIEYHKKFKFDLIFMDLMLKGTNGIEATQRIRVLPAPLNKVHIIALTANAFPEDKERCMQGGMNDFLTKPLSPNTLYEVVMNFILTQNYTNQTMNINSLPSIDQDLIFNQINNYLCKTYGFKKEQVQKIMAVTKTSLNDTLKEIEDALIEKNNKLLGILFHRLKGSLRNIGLNESSDWAKSIEQEILEQNNVQNAESTLRKIREYLQSFLTQ